MLTDNGTHSVRVYKGSDRRPVPSWQMRQRVIFELWRLLLSRLLRMCESRFPQRPKGSHNIQARINGKTLCPVISFKNLQSVEGEIV